VNTSTPPVGLMLMTVGGSPEPVAFSLEHWRPMRVKFVVSAASRESAVQAIVAARSNGFSELDAGRYDFLQVRDADDFAQVFDDLRQLADEVDEWRRENPETQVVADITGGTKSMSAALMLAMARCKCDISYIGGAERERGGLGSVISGAERPVRSLRTWDTSPGSSAWTAAATCVRSRRNVVEQSKNRYARWPSQSGTEYGGGAR
jgi:hypothetical protein